MSIVGIADFNLLLGGFGLWWLFFHVFGNMFVPCIYGVEVW